MRSCSGKKKQLSPASKLIFGALFLFTLLPGMAHSDHRVSDSYVIHLDSVGMAGGASSSASYHQSENAIGQESVCGFSSSASYHSHEGVIQLWGSASGWMLY